MQPPIQRRPRSRLRWLLLGALAVLLLGAGVAIWRAEAEAAPPLTIHRTIASHVRLAGKGPKIAWPREGQAAVEVEGIGSLGTRGGEDPVPIASVAKVMTAYLTLRRYPLEPGEAGFTITVTRADAKEEDRRVALDQSTVDVKAGETLTERQALQALMLPSANNVAALLAVHQAGSVAGFVERMNATARQLGMYSTHYTDPSGYDPGTVSTAGDQLKLARLAMRDPTFARIVSLPSARLPVVGVVENSNHLVETGDYVGIKTGSDEAAGGCLLFARRVEVGGRSLTVLGAVLGQRQGELVSSALDSAHRLAESVAESLKLRTAVPAGTAVLSARNVDGDRVLAATRRPLREIGWPGMRLPVKVRIRTAPDELDEGERVGTVTVRGPSARSGAVVATASLGGPSLIWRLKHLF
jgi:D-alanyl-D-alanine carboxypeptidase (penicillin-binding protein 5/6)